jgi:hypothetical protein
LAKTTKSKSTLPTTKYGKNNATLIKINPNLIKTAKPKKLTNSLTSLK